MEKILVVLAAMGAFPFVASAIKSHMAYKYRIVFEMSYESRDSFPIRNKVSEKKAKTLVEAYLKENGYANTGFSSSLTDMSGNWVPWKVG